MNNIINTLKRTGQTLLITHITDEETKLGSILLKLILHDELLKLITRIDNNLLHIIMLQNILGEALAERTGSACNQNRFII